MTLCFRVPMCGLTPSPYRREQDEQQRATLYFKVWPYSALKVWPYSAVKPFAPAPALADTGSHLRPALRPRPSFDASPLRRLHSDPGPLNAEDLDHALISGLNHTARCSLSTLHAALTVRRCKTRLRLVVSLYRPRLRGVGFLRLVSPIVYLRYDPPFMGFAWRD